MMRRILKCFRTHDLRSNADAVARNAEDERSPVSLRLTEPALTVFCDRPCAVRLTVDNWHVRTHALRSNACLFPAAYK
jgi:hypothetical protein